jgi:hypothetical protein
MLQRAMFADKICLSITCVFDYIPERFYTRHYTFFHFKTARAPGSLWREETTPSALQPAWELHTRGSVDPDLAQSATPHAYALCYIP